MSSLIVFSMTPEFKLVESYSTSDPIILCRQEIEDMVVTIDNQGGFDVIDEDRDLCAHFITSMPPLLNINTYALNAWYASHLKLAQVSLSAFATKALNSVVHCSPHLKWGQSHDCSVVGIRYVAQADGATPGITDVIRANPSIYPLPYDGNNFKTIPPEIMVDVLKAWGSFANDVFYEVVLPFISIANSLTMNVEPSSALSHVLAERDHYKSQLGVVTGQNKKLEDVLRDNERTNIESFWRMKTLKP